MNNTLDVQGKAEILARLSKLCPDIQRQWGKMTPNQMVCHLTDSFVGMMGGKEVSSKSNFFTRSVVKQLALKSPFPWPHSVRTMPEMDQEIGGTPPDEFDRDRQKLILAIERFANQPKDFRFSPHPIFGTLTEAEWMVWGYRHCDHHFRQFGI